MIFKIGSLNTLKNITPGGKLVGVGSHFRTEFLTNFTGHADSDCLFFQHKACIYVSKQCKLTGTGLWHRSVGLLALFGSVLA